MAMWDKLFKKKDEGSDRLNPIVQKQPMPSAAPRVSAARPVQPLPAKGEPSTKVREKPEPESPKGERETRSREKPEPEPPKPERETKSRKKPEETKSRRPSDSESFLKRGLARQAHGEHDAAIEDFSKAIELDGNLAKAYAARGVSKEAKGDGDGAKGDYSKSIQIEIMNEIGRQMRENPDVEM
jgi:tetratricopeptide (TPR) repeat protein